MSEESYHLLKVDLIDPSPKNIGDRYRDDEEDEALIASIRKHGVLQPIIVFAVEGGRYGLIAGERRLRAVRAIGAAEIPAVIRPHRSDLDDEARKAENFARRGYSAWEMMLAVEDAVLSERKRAASAGTPEPKMEAIGAGIGLSGRTVYIYWGISGHLDQTSRDIIQASTVLRRQLTAKDLERLVGTHQLERVDLLRRFEETYSNEGKPVSAGKVERMSIERQVPLRAGKKRFGVCRVKPDHGAAIDTMMTPRVDVLLKLHPSTDLEDPVVREGLSKHLRTVLLGLVRQVNSGFDKPFEPGLETSENGSNGSEGGDGGSGQSNSRGSSGRRSRVRTETSSSQQEHQTGETTSSEESNEREVVDGEDGGMVDGK